MIYVLASSVEEGTRFVVQAHLRDGVNVITTSGGLTDRTERFMEEDEVFLINAGQTLTQVANRIYGNSWPRPHIFKHVPVKASPVPVG